MKKMNNKGFSLVELIIVIAIMAILVVVLAPQYLKYVEKSRISSDAQTAVEFEDALMVAASDPDLTTVLDQTKTYKVTSTTAGAISIDSNAQTLLNTAGSIDTTKTYKFTSQLFKAAARTIELKYDATAKQWKVTNDCPDTNS